MSRRIKPEPMDVGEETSGSQRVKTEIMDQQVAENEVLRCIESETDGVSTISISTLLPHISQEQKQDAINSLLASRRVIVVKESTRDGHIIMKFKIDRSTKLTDVSEEEQAVFSVIEEAGNQGIWQRDLNSKIGLPTKTMSKILKTLEKSKHIKSVKAVNSTKKYYMLYGLQPHASLTGGTFHTEQELDTQLISVLVKYSTDFLVKKDKEAREKHPTDIGIQKELSFIRPQEVAEFVNNSGIVNISISLDDIENILQVGMLDGNIERRVDGKVRATLPKPFVSPLACMPCGICPLINDCKPGHVISPETCQYMTDWLNDK